MKKKFASLLIKARAVVTVLALVVIVFGPVIWLEFPDVSLWALIYAFLALWGFSPEIRPIRELWIFGICRIIITAWELIEVWFFTQDAHPATRVGLMILLVGTVLYVGGLALWNKWNKADSPADSPADGPADSPAQEE